MNNVTKIVMMALLGFSVVGTDLAAMDKQGAHLGRRSLAKKTVVIDFDAEDRARDARQDASEEEQALLAEIAQYEAKTSTTVSQRAEDMSKRAQNGLKAVYASLPNRPTFAQVYASLPDRSTVTKVRAALSNVSMPRFGCNRRRAALATGAVIATGVSVASQSAAPAGIALAIGVTAAVKAMKS